MFSRRLFLQLKFKVQSLLPRSIALSFKLPHFFSGGCDSFGLSSACNGPLFFPFEFESLLWINQRDCGLPEINEVCSLYSSPLWDNLGPSGPPRSLETRRITVMSATASDKFYLRVSLYSTFIWFLDQICRLLPPFPFTYLLLFILLVRALILILN